MNKRLILTLIVLLMAVCSFVANAQVSFGNASGTITLVEYFDYNCPVCRHYAPTIDQIAQRNTDLKIIQRVVPVLAPSSNFIDRAVLASLYQHKFAQMQWAVLRINARETIPLQAIKAVSLELGINYAQLVRDMHQPFITKQLQQNYQNYLALKTTRIPAVVIYRTHQPKDKVTLIGEQSLNRLQHVIAFVASNNAKTNFIPLQRR